MFLKLFWWCFRRTMIHLLHLFNQPLLNLLDLFLKRSHQRPIIFDLSFDLVDLL